MCVHIARQATRHRVHDVQYRNTIFRHHTVWRKPALFSRKATQFKNTANWGRLPKKQCLHIYISTLTACLKFNFRLLFAAAFLLCRAFVFGATMSSLLDNIQEEGHKYTIVCRNCWTLLNALARNGHIDKPTHG